jgi:hypothetical protein
VYLLYLDDSGSASNAQDNYFVLAGICVHETQVSWISGELERIAHSVEGIPADELEFRGVAMLSGRSKWRGMKKSERVQLFMRAINVCCRSRWATCLFGAAVHKAAIAPEDPVHYAFEQICNRFDRFLQRNPRKSSHRGLLILDKSTYETSLQSLAREFRAKGHRWGVLERIFEVPLFVDSKATRLIQLADLVAYSIRRHYEKGDQEYLSAIQGKFDHAGGVLYGLVHHKPAADACSCAACQRRP